jgi:hypothetical protein
MLGRWHRELQLVAHTIPNSARHFFLLLLQLPTKLLPGPQDLPRVLPRPMFQRSVMSRGGVGLALLHSWCRSYAI